MTGAALVVQGDALHLPLPDASVDLCITSTHCPQGHPYDDANTYRHPRNGSRGCKACRREATRQWRGRNGGR